MAVEAWHIHTGNLRNLFKEGILVPIPGLGPVVQGYDLHGAVLPFSQRKEVDKLCQRLRVEGADASRKDDIF